MTPNDYSRETVGPDPHKEVRMVTGNNGDATSNASDNEIDYLYAKYIEFMRLSAEAIRPVLTTDGARDHFETTHCTLSKSAFELELRSMDSKSRREYRRLLVRGYTMDESVGGDDWSASLKANSAENSNLSL